MSGDPGLPFAADGPDAPWNRPDAPKAPYAAQIVFRDGVARYLKPDGALTDWGRNAERFASVTAAQDALLTFHSCNDFHASVVDLDDPEHTPDVDDDLLEGSPFCECGEQASEDEEASNLCDACGKVLS